MDKLVYLLNSLRTLPPQPTLDGQQPIWIYGAGHVGKDIFRVLVERKLPVAGFLDLKASPGAMWQDAPILYPNDSHLSHTDRQGVKVVIGIHNRDVDLAQVFSYLSDLEYQNVWSVVQVFDSLSVDLGDRFWLTDRSFYPAHEQEITSALDLWADEISRDMYLNMISFRLDGQYAHLSAPDLINQYFLPDRVWNSPLRFLDCGAYDGDTLRLLAERKTTVAAVAAFEPDLKNFARLVQQVAQYSWWEDVTLWPCAVSGRTEQLRFVAGGGESSALSNVGDEIVQAVALDDVLPSFRPNLIKMDIEGAEIDALCGARKMIERYRPGLAISVYHRPAHLWQVLHLLHSWKLGYRFYLRSHAYNGFDTVLYAQVL